MARLCARVRVLHRELAQFLAPERVKQQRRENGAITLALERVGLGRGEQLARLMIAKRGRFTVTAFRLRPLHTLDHVMRNGVAFAEIVEQRGQRRETVTDGRITPRLTASGQARPQIVAPGDDMRARHRPKLFRSADAGELHEVLHRVLIGAAGVPVGEVGKPFDRGRHVGELLERGGG